MLQRLSVAPGKTPLVLEMAKLEEDALRESRLGLQENNDEEWTTTLLSSPSFKRYIPGANRSAKSSSTNAQLPRQRRLPAVL